MTERECGDCQVCCELPAVGSLQKPMYTPCAHQCAAGCGIYERRPTECRAFECAWLRGDEGLADDDRPDRSGLMFETCASEHPGAETIRYVRVWEAKPEALLAASERALTLLAELSERWPIKLYRHGSPPSYGPTDAEAPPTLRALALELQRREQRGERVGRNEPCPCGSGKKFKKCHGR